MPPAKVKDSIVIPTNFRIYWPIKIITRAIIKATPVKQTFLTMMLWKKLYALDGSTALLKKLMMINIAGNLPPEMIKVSGLSLIKKGSQR